MHGSDEELFARFRRDGDAAAFGALVDRAGPELLQLALHLCGRPAEAEDLLHETLLVALERADTWDEARPLRPWLVGILTNRARLARRRGARAPDPGRLHMLPAPPAPDDSAVELELDRDVEDALLKVPESYQSVLVLRLRHHLSVPEIANALRKPPGTVRSRLQRGLEHLRRLLPAGYAGACLALLGRPARGLAAVRAAVLAERGTLASSGSAPASLSTLLLMKPAVLGLALCAALALGILFVARNRPSAGAAEPPASPDGAPAALLAVARAPAEARAELAGSAEAPAAEAPAPAAPAPAAAPAGRGGLVIVARHEGTGLPAAGHLALVSTFGEQAPYYDPLVVETDLLGEARLDDLPAGLVYVQLLRGSEDSIEVRPGELARLGLRAWRGITVDARVVDRAGEPVPGAELWVSERFRSNLGHAVARADAAGRATLESLKDTQHVAARAPGRASSPLYPVRGAPGATLELTLVLDRPGGAVRGTVRDARGAPVPGAVVFLGPEDAVQGRRGDDGLALLGPPLRRAYADLEGRFCAESLDLGELDVLARALGHGPARARIAVEAGGTAELELVLPPEAVLAGRVTNMAGEPLESAMVRTLPPGALGGGRALSLGDGRFELRGLAAGETAVEAAHHGGGMAEARLAFAAGATTEWHPILAPVPRLSGVVLDARGAPLTGWSVAAAIPGSAPVARSTPTDVQGRFQLTGVPEEPLRLLVHEPAGWQRFPRLVVHDVLPGAELVLSVPDPPAGGALAAEVVHADGTPAAPGELTLWHVEERLWRSYPLDGDGRLRVAWVPPGTVHLDVRVPGAPWLDLSERRIEEGRTLDLGRLVLPAGGVLAGRLECPPAALATLSFLLAVPGKGEAGVVSCEEGSYRTSALAPGAYILEVRGEGVAPARFEFQVAAGEETRRDIALAPAPTRAVLFDLPEGARGPGGPQHLWCELRDAAGARVWMNGSAPRDGERFAVRISAPAGGYRLSAGTESGLRAGGDFVIAEGPEAAPLELVLRRD